MNQPPIFYDQHGLIVHDGMDGGDTAQREGWYWLGVWIRQTVLNDPWPEPRDLAFADVIRLLEPNRDGVFYRHPTLPPWNNPHDKAYGLSRDQMVPLVAAMGVWGYTAELRRLWNALPQDPITGLRHTFNGDWVTVLGQRVWHEGDVVGPMTIDLFRRAWNEDPSASGTLGDEELRLNVVLRLAAGMKDRDDVGDDLNLMVMLLISLLRFSSPVSRSAVELYKLRPHSFGSYLGEYRAQYGVDTTALPGEIRRRVEDGISAGWRTDASGPYGAVSWYHLQEFGANPMLAEVYEPIIERYFE